MLEGPIRKNSREERMTVNSVGEGCIMVINSNGNIDMVIIVHHLII